MRIRYGVIAICFLVIDSIFNQELEKIGKEEKKLLRNLGDRKNWYTLELLKINEELRIVVTVISIARNSTYTQHTPQQRLVPVTEK